MAWNARAGTMGIFGGGTLGQGTAAQAGALVLREFNNASDTYSFHTVALQINHLPQISVTGTAQTVVEDAQVNSTSVNVSVYNSINSFGGVMVAARALRGSMASNAGKARLMAPVRRKWRRSSGVRRLSCGAFICEETDGIERWRG